MRIAALAAAAALTAGCGSPHTVDAERITGGDAARGRVALRQYACVTCHVIPGVTGADGLVGPPLNGVGSRHYVGGVLPNTPDNMMRWIRFPQDVSPLTAMPNLGVTERDARDMAAYLYTLP